MTFYAYNTLATYTLPFYSAKIVIVAMIFQYLLCLYISEYSLGQHRYDMMVGRWIWSPQQNA